MVVRNSGRELRFLVILRLGSWGPGSSEMDSPPQALGSCMEVLHHRWFHPLHRLNFGLSLTGYLHWGLAWSCLPGCCPATQAKPLPEGGFGSWQTLYHHLSYRGGFRVLSWVRLHRRSPFCWCLIDLYWLTLSLELHRQDLFRGRKSLLPVDCPFPC